MAQREQSIVDVIINGEKAFSTVKEMRQAVRQLAVEFNAATDPAARDRIAKAYQQVNTQLREQQELLKGGTSMWTKFRSEISAFGVGVGLFALANGLKDAVMQFGEAERGARLLRNQITIMGGESSEKVRELNEQAEQLKGAFDDEAITRAQVYFAQFGLGADAIKKVIPIANDFAAGTGQSIEDASRKIALGINGNVKGLREFGIVMEDTGSKSKNLEIIMQKLNEKFEGQAALIQTDTLGAFERFKIMMGDIAEFLGGAFVETVEFAGNMIQKIFDPIGYAAKKASEDVRKEMIATRQAIKDELLEKNDGDLQKYLDNQKHLLEISQKEKNDLMKQGASEDQATNLKRVKQDEEAAKIRISIAEKEIATRADKKKQADDDETAAAKAKNEKIIREFENLQRDIQKAEDNIFREQQGQHQREITAVEQKYAALRERAAGHSAELVRIDAAEKQEKAQLEAEHNKIIEGLRDQLYFSKLSKDEQELQDIRNKYEKQIEDFAGFQDKIKELEALREQELNDKRAEQAQKVIDDRVKLQEEIYLLSLDNNTREVVEEAAKWDAIIEKATAAGLETQALYAAQQAALTAIIKGQAEKRTGIISAENKKQIDQAFKFTDAIGNIYFGLFEMAGAMENKRSTAFKAQAVFQIAVSQGQAIANAVASAKGLTGFDYIVQIAVATAAAISGIVQAQKALSDAGNPPKYEKGTRLEGPDHSNGGIKMYRSDTGKLVGEAAGGEYMFGPEFGELNRSLLDYLLHRNQTDGGKVTATDLISTLTGAPASVNYPRIIETARIERYTRGTFIQPAGDSSIQARAGVSENDVDLTPTAQPQVMLSVIESNIRTMAQMQNSIDRLNENIEEGLGFNWNTFKKDFKRLTGIEATSGLK